MPGRQFWVDADAAVGAAGTLVTAFEALRRHPGEPGAAENTEPVGPRATTAGAEDRSPAFANLDVVFADLVAARDVLFGLIEGAAGRPR